MNQRWRSGRSSFRRPDEPINPAAYEVAAIADDSTAKAFVHAHHYAASYPAARFRLGLFRAAVLVGVAVFSQPCNDLALRPLPAESSVELGRFVLLDDVPGNGETWFLARAFDHLRREGLSGVVSFSDPMPRTDASGAVTFKGHVGTIYQAFNGVYLGRAREDTIRLLASGHVIHNRALAKVRAKVRGWRYVVDQLVANGASRPEGDDLRAWLDAELPRITRKVRHPGNHKYAWALDRAARKLLPETKPYPKKEIAIT